jgi:hypothetical protein
MIVSKDAIARYGVLEQVAAGDAAERAVEAIRLVGYSVIESGLCEAEIGSLGGAFDRELISSHAKYGGPEALAEIDEHNTIRAPLASEPLFLSLATNANVLAVCRQLMGDYIVLNQQNGVVNPPNGDHYRQGSYHRDLPYQHFVASRPLAVSAIFCIDHFTRENGATFVIPASHKSEAFPSSDVAKSVQICVSAPAGCFIIFDSMLFHRGGVNKTPSCRRAVNQIYSIPYLRQQLDLPALLGPGYSSDAALRRLLGYQARSSADLADYYESVRAKKESQG